jgi:hypothetical protein
MMAPLGIEHLRHTAEFACPRHAGEPDQVRGETVGAVGFKAALGDGLPPHQPAIGGAIIILADEADQPVDRTSAKLWAEQDLIKFTELMHIAKRHGCARLGAKAFHKRLDIALIQDVVVRRNTDEVPRGGLQQPIGICDPAEPCRLNGQ